MLNKKSEWDRLYKNQDIESMPWYRMGLDPDFIEAFKKMGITSGHFLDIGTGPATQAIALAKMGFKVTATDISKTAIAMAKEKAEIETLNIKFRQDNIINTYLQEEFDYVFDRGIFHVIQPEDRTRYVNNIHKLLCLNGLLFLKCFSYKEKADDGPYRFTPDQIRELFLDKFKILSIKETYFQGTINAPKALFCVIKKLRFYDKNI